MKEFFKIVVIPVVVGGNPVTFYGLLGRHGVLYEQGHIL